VINLILSSLFNLRAHRGPTRRVFIAIDAATGIAPAEYLRCLRPWASWVQVTGALQLPGPALIPTIESSATEGADLLVVVTADPALAKAARTACAGRRQTCVDSAVPPEGSREMALFQEVLHHDFELGGFNEWTGQGSQFGAPTLRMMSLVHCRRMYPGYVDSYVARLRAGRPGHPIEALDVGCGSISRLRWGALNGLMTVTGIDPLLDMYAVVRERHGLGQLAEIRCAREVSIGAEAMSAHFPPAAFDFVYSANALDHVEDPTAVMETVGEVLRPGGILAIQVYTREGTRENWWQLHQFDMYVNEAGVFVSETKAGLVRPIFSPRCGLAVREVVVKNDEHTWLVAERVPQS
jgi:SAM-dependent methyltransferase